MKKSAFKMKYQGKQSTFPFKSPVKKEKLIGPVKPMVDKDGDGIPLGIDINDNDAGVGKKTKDSSAGKRKTKNGGKPVSPDEEKGKEIKIDPTAKPPGYWSRS